LEETEGRVTQKGVGLNEGVCGEKRSEIVLKNNTKRGKKVRKEEELN